jgi:uncharacterized protein YuzE
MRFELRIKFVCEEGDEMNVLDLDDEILHLIEMNSNVKIRGMRLFYAENSLCPKEGRKHATSN